MPAIEAGPDRLCALLAVGRTGRCVRGDRATLAPMKGRRSSETDRRDAERLARSYRSRDLTAFGFRTRRRSRCAIWCERAKRPSRIIACASPAGQVSLPTGRRPAVGMKAWTIALHGLGAAGSVYADGREATMLDYLHEVDHMGERVKRLEQADHRSREAGYAGSCRRWSRAYRLCAASRRFRRCDLADRQHHSLDTRAS